MSDIRRNISEKGERGVQISFVRHARRRKEPEMATQKRQETEIRDVERDFFLLPTGVQDPISSKGDPNPWFRFSKWSFLGV